MLKRLKSGYAVILFITFSAMISGCGGGGGWSSGDTTGQSSALGIVQGYAYQQAGAATRHSAARAILVPMANATVTIAGKTGTTDVNGFYKIQNVPAGTYSLQITEPGFSPIMIPSVSVVAGQPTIATPQGDATHVFSPSATANFTVASTPAGAAVFINGQNTAGVTPNTFQLAAGQYQIKLTATGYENYEQSVTLGSAGGSVNYSLTLLTTAINFLTPSLTATIGGTATPAFNCTINSTTAACQPLTWTSANTSIATVDANTGIVTGVAAGNTTITAARAQSDVSGSIPVTVIATGETLQQIIINAPGVVNNTLGENNNGAADFTSTCVYSLTGTSACPSSCVYSTSVPAAAAIDSTGGLSCTGAGGVTDIKLTCGIAQSNTVTVSCATTSATLQLEAFGAPDTNGDGVADAAFANPISIAAGTDLIVKLKVANATAITGFRTDLSVDETYISPRTQTDAANCAAFSNLAYNAASLCIDNFGTQLAPSNPFFGTTTLDSVNAVTNVSGATVNNLYCVDPANKPNRLDCAISTRKTGAAQPSASGSDYFVYFLLKTSAAAASGSHTTVSINRSTMQVLTAGGVKVQIGSGQVTDLTVNFQ